MSLYYPGYAEARQWVLAQTDLGELLNYIDGLQGRGNLENATDLGEVKSEALRQCKEEFTDKSSPEYEQVEFWVGVYNATR